jgi:hypothetical protein
MAIDTGTGTSITFQTSGFVANITDIGINDISRASVATSHLGTTNAMTFIPGKLYDPGGLELEIQFDPETDPPIDDAAETIVVTFPGGETWSFTGFATDFTASVPLEELMTGTLTIKASGAISFDGS